MFVDGSIYTVFYKVVAFESFPKVGFFSLQNLILSSNADLPTVLTTFFLISLLVYLGIFDFFLVECFLFFSPHPRSKAIHRFQQKVFIVAISYSYQRFFRVATLKFIDKSGTIVSSIAINIPTNHKECITLFIFSPNV